MNKSIIKTCQGHHDHAINYVMVGLQTIGSFLVEQSEKVSWKNHVHIETLIDLLR